MTDLTIMTYNMLNAPGDRLDALVDVVKSVSPDILACQEIVDEAGMWALASRLDLEPVWGRGLIPQADSDPPFPTQNIAIFTRLPVVMARAHAGQRAALHRPVLEVRCRVRPDLHVTVATLHLISKLAPRSIGARWLEACDVRDIVSGIEGPHCVVGDFNAWAKGEGDLSEEWEAGAPGRYRQAVRGGLLDVIATGRYADAWRNVHPDPSEVGNTFVSRTYSRVDFILVSDELRPWLEDCWIVRDGRTEEASDHYPVVARFCLPDRAS